MQKKRILILAVVTSSLLISCSSIQTPEEVVEDYTLFVSSGECEKAMDLCIDYAKEHLQGSIDAGCTPYDTRVDSVICEIKGEDADCVCYEYREGLGQLWFPYELKKVGEHWKLTNTVKSPGMEM